MNMQNERKNKILNNQSGFIAADFIFSFVLILSCGIIIFALTFSLATIEIAQYITWSSARAYSAANLTKDDSEKAGRSKFNNLSKNFPLLTGAGDIESPWFVLSDLKVGEPSAVASDLGGLAGNYTNKSKSTAAGAAENRQPWTGVSANLELKLFKSIRVPFLGKIVSDDSAFSIPIKAFLLRNPSQAECIQFYKKENRFEQGIRSLESGWSGIMDSAAGYYVPIEDNGC